MGAGVARITHRETIGGDTLPYMASISALEVRTGPAEAELRVFAGSGADGGLSVIALESGGPARMLDQRGAGPEAGTAGLAGLGVATVGGVETVIPAGRADDRIAFHPLTEAGSFAPVQGFAGADLPGGLAGLAVLPSGDGARIYHTDRNGDGIGGLELTPDMAPRDLGMTDATDVTTLASGRIDGHDFVFAASGSRNAVTSYRVWGSGELSAADTVSPEDGLYVAAPAALDVAVSGGITYLVLAATESQSLSVVQVVPWGGLSVTDHLIDSGGTRFGAPTALDTIKIGHRVLVAAGGGDDGVTLFELSPDGRLHFLTQTVDTAETALQNVSAIALAPAGPDPFDGLELLAGSATEPGISRFHVDLEEFGPLRRGTSERDWLNGIWADDLITGFGGDDVIRGHVGDDRMIDGPGMDLLFGGRGEDVFAMTPDRDLDVIRDFMRQDDRIDLSAYPRLHGMDQLNIVDRSYGVSVSYAGDMLRVEPKWGRLEADMLTADNFIF